MKIFTFCLLLTVISLLVSNTNVPTAQAESAQKMKIKEEEIRQNMVTISRQLGITCTECHNMKNLADASMKNFQIARDHMKIVEILKLNGMDGKKEAEASCYMCHRGQMKIPYKEKLSGH